MAVTAPPGYTVIGTSTAPGWQAAKAANLANALRGAFSAAQERREREQQREAEEIKTFLTMAQQEPALATSMGDDFKRRYGRDYPMLGPMVDILRDRQAERGRINSAGDRFLAEQGRLEQQYATQRAAFDAMPDSLTVEVPVPTPWGAMSTPVDVPNLDKQAAGQRLGQIDPGAIPMMAAHALSPADRARARMASQARGYELPTEFDPFEDLSAEGKAILAAQRGLLTGDAAEWARTEGGLQTSRAKLQEQTYGTSEREAKVEDEIEVEREKDRLMREREEQEDRLTRGRMGYGEQIQTRLIAQRPRRGGGGESVHLWELAAEESEAAVEEWDRGLKEAVEEAGSVTSDRAAAKRSYVEDNGSRPAKLTEAASRQLERQIRAWLDAGELDDAEVETATAAIVAEVTRLTSRGMSVSEAIRKATSADEEEEGGRRLLPWEDPDHPLRGAGVPTDQPWFVE